MGWLFLSDGTIDEVDLNTQQVTGLRAAGVAWQPISPQYWASAKVWRPQFYGSQAGQQGGVLFGSPAGLYAWDGTTLSKPGDPAPDWLTDLAETAPSAPIPDMPQGLPGIYAMEVCWNRLWVAGKDVISFSAPANGANFSTVDGGGSFGYFGDRLVYSWMDLVGCAGYLYLFGDSSTDAINNVTLTGQAGSLVSPVTTDFSYFNVDPQTGQRFPRPVGRLGRFFVTFNGAGVWLLQGGQMDAIGDKVSNLWLTLDVSQYEPTFAPANMFGFRVLLLNGRFTDPWGVTRNLILIWHPTVNNHFWSVASQGVELTNIGSYEQDSVITPYGTDGTHLYRLFAQPDPALKKRYASKALRSQSQAGQLTISGVKRVYAELHDNDGRGVSLNMTVKTFGGVPGGSQSAGFELSPGAIHTIEPAPMAGAGITVAIDFESVSPDFTLERLHIASEERTLWGA